MADLTTLVTDFPTNQGSLALVQANTPFTQSVGAVTVASNALTVVCATSFANAARSGNYSWAGGGLYSKPVPAPEGTAATNQETFLAIADASSTDASIRIAYDWDLAPTTPTITAVLYSTDNTFTDVSTPVSETYSAVNHAWLGWYYDASNIYWMKSADGATWSIMRQVARSLGAWLTTQTDLNWEFSTNRVGGSNTNATLDNINTGGVAPGAGTPGPTTRPIVGGNSSAVMRASSW
ncbi:hypothetical protein [Cryptosporangium sp. NPDC051539]|uniref:hypothetical protein n=1 Tax=Cryptosporangium sp. NPDC051539 TaxID=3363962 RepID=UPI0037B3538B